MLAGIGEAHALEDKARLRLPARLRTRAVLHRHRLVLQRVVAPGGAQRVRQPPADMGDFRDRQEGGHGEQGQKRQEARIDRSRLDQHRAAHHHRQAAEAGQHLQQAFLQGHFAEERQAERDMPVREPVEAVHAPALVLEGDDFAEPLHGIDGIGAKLARRLARLRAEPVHPAPHQEGAEADGREERNQRERNPRARRAEHDDDDCRDQHRDEGGRHRVREEILDELDIVRGEVHQVAGPPPHEIGRRQPVQLAEGVDPHLRQQPVGHVVRDPGFEPVHDAGQGRQHPEPDQQVVPGLAVLQAEDDERAHRADAYEGEHAHDAEQEGEAEAPLPRQDHAHQRGDHLEPGKALRPDDPFGGRQLRPARRGVQGLGGRAVRGVDEKVALALLGLARLLAHERGIDAARQAHEFAVRAAFDDLPLLHREDAVAVDDAGEPVRQDQRRAALHEAVERLLDYRFIVGIDGGKGLVQHQDRRIAKHGAGNRDPLALPARKLDPLLADDRVVAVRQRVDEAPDIGDARRFLDLLPAGVRAAHADVFADGAVEQEGVLVDDRDVPADLREAHVPEVDAAERDAPGIGIEEAQQQAHDGGLAAAALPDHADALARRNREGKLPMRRASRAGIAEGHVLEGDGRLQPVRLRVPGTVGHLLPGVQNGVDALGRRQADHALVEHGAQVPHRAEYLDAHHQDDEQARQLHLAGGNPGRAERQRRGRADGDHAIGDAAREHVRAKHPHGAPEQLARLAGQQVGARRALPEGLERAEALD